MHTNCMRSGGCTNQHILVSSGPSLVNHRVFVFSESFHQCTLISDKNEEKNNTCYGGEVHSVGVKIYMSLKVADL